MKKKNAFTLAEVLITLGIIGIVAAMTLPTLIEKHKKKVFVTKMKYTYSVLNNAFLMAQQEYGDPKDWDWGKGLTQENTLRIIQTYISPYLAKSYESWSTYNGSVPIYIIRLKNGIALSLLLDGSWDTSKGEEGEKEASISTIYIIGSMKNKQSNLQSVDRDYSRDDFVMVFNRGTVYYKNDRLTFFNHGGHTREEIRDNSKYACNNSIAKNMRLNCGMLIFHDGWEIKDDYPW